VHRGEGRDMRQKAGTRRAQRKLKRSWEPETGAVHTVPAAATPAASASLPLPERR